MQAQLNGLFGLHRTSSRVSIDSITSFAGSTNTKKAFKRFCQNLYQIGVRADMIKEKESEILDIFRSQNTDTSGQIYNSNITDQGNSHNLAASSQTDITDPSKPQNTAVSSHVDEDKMMDQSQLPSVSNCFSLEIYLYFGDRNTYTDGK